MTAQNQYTDMGANKRTPKRVGLALGSGGARGFCHIGVIKVLEENNIPIDFISGCSIGSIVGGCYSVGVKINDMINMAERLSKRMIMDFDILLKRQGLFKGNRATTLIKRFIGDKTFDDCKIPFAATATEIQTGKLKTIISGKLCDAMRASMSIPVAFQYVETESGEKLVDGGVLERIPITAVKNLGADIIIAVDALGAPHELADSKSIFSIIEQTYLLLDWESTRQKIKKADIVITPNQGNKSLYAFKNNMESIDSGIIAAQKMLPKIKRLLQK